MITEPEEQGNGRLDESLFPAVQLLSASISVNWGLH